MKTDYLKSQIERHQTLDQQLRWLTLAWKRSHRLLEVLVEARVRAAGMSDATTKQQEVWQRFRASHCLRQIAKVLELLEVRSLTLTDFVEVWLATEDYHAALAFLWRRSSPTALTPANGAHAP